MLVLFLDILQNLIAEEVQKQVKCAVKSLHGNFYNFKYKHFILGMSFYDFILMKLAN